MADETTKRIIEVEAKFATLAKMREEIDENKKILKEWEAEAGKSVKYTEDYQRALAETNKIQSDYNQQMRIAAKESTAVKGSYNDLVNQLARLKEAWKQAKPGTDEYTQLTLEVNKTKKQLEGMDHSIGNWQRNVGNYGNSISKIAGLFGQSGRAAAGAITGIQGMTMGLKTMSATPVIAILGVLVGILGKLKDAFKSSEEASNRMAVALAPLKAGGDLLKIAFEGVAKAVAGVAEWLGKVADKLGLFTDRMRENQSLTKDEIALRQRQREVTISNAKLELEAARQLNISRDKANHSVKERVAALEAAKAAEKAILNNELEIAQKQFDLAKRRAALAPNDAAANDALAQQEANLYQVQKNYEQGISRITSQYSAALIEMRGQTKAALADAEADSVKLMEIADGWQDKMSAAEKRRMEERKRLAEEAKETNAMIAAFDKELEDEITAVADQSTQEISDQVNAQNKAAEDMETSFKVSASAIADIMDTVAGAMQNDIKARLERGEISEEQAEKEFENVKRMQYATTWINTLSAVVSALAEPELPWVAKAANAATALATGIANTVKIANTTLGSTQTASAVGAGVTQAPQVSVQIPEYRTITSAADERTLNDRAGSQKVYLVTSELEAHEQGRKVALAESTF